MRIYSAGEAIGPAWEHTKALLFDHRGPGRRWSRVLKICFIALGAQLGSGLNSSWRGGNHGAIPPVISAFLVLLGVVGAVISVVVGITLLYVSSRLQFVLFDIVLLRDDRVAPAWSRHGLHTWRWAGIKIVALLALGVLLSPLLVPLAVALIALFHSSAAAGGAGGHFAFPAFRALLLLILEIFALFVLFTASYRLFTTVALPGLALENLSFGAVFQRAWHLFRADVGAMLLYAVLQPLLLGTLGGVVFLCWIAAVVLPAVPLALAGWLLWSPLHGSMAGMFLLGTLGSIVAIAVLVWTLLAYVLAIGTLLTFTQAYSLYFVGGRYPLLGQYLAPDLQLYAVPPVWNAPPA